MDFARVDPATILLARLQEVRHVRDESRRVRLLGRNPCGKIPPHLERWSEVRPAVVRSAHELLRLRAQIDGLLVELPPLAGEQSPPPRGQLLIQHARDLVPSLGAVSLAPGEGES